MTLPLADNCCCLQKSVLSSDGQQRLSPSNRMGNDKCRSEMATLRQTVAFDHFWQSLYEPQFNTEGPYSCVLPKIRWVPRSSLQISPSARFGNSVKCSFRSLR